MKKIMGILIITCVLLSLPGCTTNKQIKQRADEIVERYNSGELEYDTAKEKIKGVENAYREYVEKEANRFEASNEWSKAIDLYKKTQNYFGDKSYEKNKK